MKKNVVLLLFFLAVMHISNMRSALGYVDKHYVENEIARLDQLLSEIQSTEGPLCTPDELAHSQVYLTQAAREFDEGDYWESEDFVALARTSTENMLKEIPGCRSDLDQDRIPDSKDQCKREPENYNGYRDEDGCPDRIPQRAILTPERIELLEPILYDKGDTTILPASDAVIKDVARILEENRDLRIRIVAHSDDHMSPEEARRVTLEQAMAVKRSLTARGVQGDRIDVEGKGSTEPIAPNTTQAGRQMNQRIEFVRLPSR